MKLYDLMKEKSGRFADTEIKSITCDSRRVEEGSLFVCINGAAFDGHKFAEDAAKKGAAVIVCEKDMGLENQLFVENSRLEFADICANWFHNPADKLKLIGVTGTNGKTSVSYMLKNILEHNGQKVGLIGTIQNMIGDDVLPSQNTTPGPYEMQSMFSLMEKAGCTYCVMEVSSHALDQNRVYGLNFEVGMFTNLTQDHLDYHITMTNYMLAKKKLFSQCKTGVFNKDDDYFNDIAENVPCKTVTFSAKGDADYSAENIKIGAVNTSFTFKKGNEKTEINANIGGKFTPYNALCAAACASELGVKNEVIAKAFADMKGVKGRAEVVPCDKGFTVIIDYAHTPDGLENILNTFIDCEKNRLTVLFGCGGDRDRTKRPKMGAIVARLADNIIVTSDNPRTEEPMVIINDILEGMKDCKKPMKVIENRVEAINYAVSDAQKGDIIILAGKGHETYQILKTGTIHLDEREVVSKALESL